MDKIAQAMERAGFPSSDGYDLPTSTKAFPDGAHYRVEISGIETPKVLLAAIDEARKQGVPFHRFGGAGGLHADPRTAQGIRPNSP
jgi:hypothetical protein